MAALADARAEVGCSVALEADRENPLRSRGRSSLQKIGCTLRQQLGLARSGTSDDRPILSRANDDQCVRLEFVDADRRPVVGSYPPRQNRHFQSRLKFFTICASTSASTEGMPALSSLLLMGVSAAR
jgi:hypothetical protein